MSYDNSRQGRPARPTRRIKRAQLMSRMNYMCEDWHLGNIDEFRMGIFVRACTMVGLGNELTDRGVDPCQFQH